MADEEALAVVVRVDEPARDVVRGAAAYLLRRRVVDVQATDLDFDLVSANGPDVYVGLAEDHEKVARACFLEEFFTHQEVGVHLSDEYLEAAVALHFLGSVRVEGKAENDEQVEA